MYPVRPAAFRPVADQVLPAADQVHQAVVALVRPAVAQPVRPRLAEHLAAAVVVQAAVAAAIEQTHSTR